MNESTKLPSDIIERLEASERSLNIGLGAVSAIFLPDVGRIEVHGELTAEGSQSQDFKLKAVVYDSEGDIVSDDELGYFANEFSGFDTFKLTCRNIPAQPSRIRVFAARW